MHFRPGLKHLSVPPRGRVTSKTAENAVCGRGGRRGLGGWSGEPEWGWGRRGGCKVSGWPEDPAPLHPGRGPGKPGGSLSTCVSYISLHRNPPPVEKLGNVAERSRLAFADNPRQHFRVLCACADVATDTPQTRSEPHTPRRTPSFPEHMAWGPCPQTLPPAREQLQNNGSRQRQHADPARLWGEAPGWVAPGQGGFWPRVVDLIWRQRRN